MLPCSISSNGVLFRDCKTAFSQHRFELLLSPALMFLVTSVMPPHAAGCVISFVLDDGVGEGDNSCNDDCRGIGGGVDGTGVGDKIVGCRIGESVERGSLSVCCVENITVLQGNVKTFLNLKIPVP